MTEVCFDAETRGVSASWIRRVVGGTLTSERAAKRSVSVLLTDDRRIRNINRRFLSHDYATDVISFGAGEAAAGPKDFLGDLVVSCQTARRVAKELGVPYRQELARYLVHGTLHLLGYRDRKKKDRERMHARQEKILKRCLKGRP